MPGTKTTKAAGWYPRFPATQGGWKRCTPSWRKTREAGSPAARSRRERIADYRVIDESLDDDAMAGFQLCQKLVRSHCVACAEQIDDGLSVFCKELGQDLVFLSGLEPLRLVVDLKKEIGCRFRVAPQGSHDQHHRHSLVRNHLLIIERDRRDVAFPRKFLKISFLTQDQENLSPYVDCSNRKTFRRLADRVRAVVVPMPALLCARERESLADDVLSGHPEIGDCVARQQPFQINNRIEIVDSVDVDLEPKAATGAVLLHNIDKILVEGISPDGLVVERQ